MCDSVHCSNAAEKCKTKLKKNNNKWDSEKRGCSKIQTSFHFGLFPQILHKVSLTDPSREKTLKILAVIRDKSLLSQSSLPPRTHHLSPMYLSAAMLLAAISWQYLSTTVAQAQGAGEGQWTRQAKPKPRLQTLGAPATHRLWLYGSSTFKCCLVYCTRHVTAGVFLSVLDLSLLPDETHTHSLTSNNSA